MRVSAAPDNTKLRSDQIRSDLIPSHLIQTEPNQVKLERAKEARERLTRLNRYFLSLSHSAVWMQEAHLS